MNRYNNRPDREKKYGEGKSETAYLRNRRQTGYNRDSQSNSGRERKYTSGNEQPREYRKETREEGYNRNYRSRDNAQNGSYNRDNRENARGRGERSYRTNQDRPKDNFRKRNDGGEGRFGRAREEKNYDRENRTPKPFAPFRKREKEYNGRMDNAAKDELRNKHYSKKKQLIHHIKKAEKADAELRLNRYISMSGVCSRRDADVLITEGRVKVNDVVVQTVGVKVKRNDKVEVDGEVIVPERKVYLVLNKPKDYVTTVEDPLERRTVMSLLEGACKERVYPVGRLDRQTTGVLLFTNDGDLSKKLTHPKYEHKKIYHVFLDKPLAAKDMKMISEGIELEDGMIKADEISYVSPDQTQVGIEIHSGRNRIVRRIFEHLGYQIEKLERVYFAGITKKNLPRGRWRFLTSEEVRILKIY